MRHSMRSYTPPTSPCMYRIGVSHVVCPQPRTRVKRKLEGVLACGAATYSQRSTHSNEKISRHVPRTSLFVHKAQITSGSIAAFGDYLTRELRRTQPVPELRLHTTARQTAIDAHQSAQENEMFLRAWPQRRSYSGSLVMAIRSRRPRKAGAGVLSTSTAAPPP